MPNPNPTPPPAPEVETDPRFPSGPWTGFFLQRELPGRHMMELQLTFRGGEIRGEGRDRVGAFVIRGKYATDSGKCHWSKRYVGRHDVSYAGYNEGKGIYGGWEIPPAWHGGFCIWPEGMADPTRPRMSEAADLPAPDPTPVSMPEAEPELVGAEAGA